MMSKYLYRCNGEFQGTIQNFIRDKLPDIYQSAPKWSWCEPLPGAAINDSGCIDTITQALLYQPLLKKGNISSDLEKITLGEARLFWPDASIHLISISENCIRWAFWQAHDDINSAQAANKEVEAGYQTTFIPRKDMKRFNLPPVEELEYKVKMYQTQGKVTAWTIIAFEDKE
jgi:hypothetical protein